jgi:hypothetical protein
MDIQQFAYIQKEYQRQNIRWLRISPDASKTGGTFILLYQDLSNTSLYDYWFESLEIAQKWAKKYYGVEESDWKSRESLEQDGIDIIDEK